MSKKSGASTWARFLGKVRARFLSGLLVVVPVIASVLILVWAFRTIDEILQPLIKTVIGTNIIGLGLAITIILVFLVGILAHNFVGEKLLQLGDALLKRIPIFKQIYNGTKQIMDSFSGAGAINRTAFQEVVMVQFPAKTLHTIAFITNEYINNNGGSKFYAVYIPTSPAPWSGYSAVVAEEDITRTNISVDDALKMCISGMMISPSHMLITHAGQLVHIETVSKQKIETKAPPV